MDRSNSTERNFSTLLRWQANRLALEEKGLSALLCLDWVSCLDDVSMLPFWTSWRLERNCPSVLCSDIAVDDWTLVWLLDEPGVRGWFRR